MKKLLFAALALAPVLAFSGIAVAQRGTGPAPKPGVPLARDLQAKMPKPQPVFEWAYPMAPTGGPRLDPDEVFTVQGADPISRAARDLGYRPRFSLETGVADWIDRARAPRTGL